MFTAGQMRKLDNCLCLPKKMTIYYKVSSYHISQDEKVYADPMHSSPEQLRTFRFAWKKEDDL